MSASRRLSDLMAEAAADEDRFFRVLQFAQQHAMISRTEDVGDLVELLAESSISLTRPLIGDLDRLVSDIRASEHDYQVFLARNPVLLDPLAAETIDRHRRGDDLITDFVIRRHDNRYVAVEIEKPRDRMFTQQGDFTAEFSHAFGQVVDFIGWMPSDPALRGPGEPPTRPLQGGVTVRVRHRNRTPNQSPHASQRCSSPARRRPRWVVTRCSDSAERWM